MVGRYDETAASVLLPDNVVARESVTRYLAAIKSTCIRIADGGAAERERPAAEPSEAGSVLMLEG
jgi:2'-acyl-2-O-sulfo-trehalose (hydroxy)phthioceranyltransferase